MLYRERLTVPVSWWVVTGLFAASLVLAIGFYLGPWWGGGVGVGCLGLLIAVFGTAAVEIQLGEDELRVGRAVIELDYLADAHALDPSATRRRSGTDADARAYLVLRPYLSTAVEITLDDADDPVPYWLVASRNPVPFAAALSQAISIRLAR
jgi:hypothetical protein